ncbi:histone-lysine n-methyltransferase H3 lysine-36 specific [Fusarium circinatum]|uniref:Histone-lysine N-methyltransferase, H3 lysine-36 specific n=1 Tax=Fusarium circinatum TaxID=48490 RepID=A0A8H5X1G1_FUSCI|nr:histone-lysine n-methyltransferase H3 lysine-36 specific [Fusarium circinatum]
MSSVSRARVAVLYQSLDPPVIDGIQKPKKPGGYMDSSADIAYSLSLSPNVDVICPHNDPKSSEQAGWSFPDTEDGILEAIEKGASHIWANTILFSSHPLQVSARIAEHQGHIKVVGQGPLIVERYDDKEFVNNLLRKLGGFTMPRAWTLNESQDTQGVLEKLNLPFPIVAKPIRGRGSHGVRNMTGPGRPGREDQASLTLLAAEALGWDYQELLRRILDTSSTLRTLRDLKPRESMRLGYSLPAAPPTPRSHSTLFAVLGRVILRVRIDLSDTPCSFATAQYLRLIPRPRSKTGLCAIAPDVLMEDDEYTTSKMEEIKLEEGTNGAQVKQEERTPMSVTNGGQEESRSPSASHDGLKSRSGSADTPSSSRPSKLSRKASQKLAASREPVLFDHLPDMTAESCNFFQLIPDCLYGSKHLGSTDNDALDCECREEWHNGENIACGEDSDCINRATKMECSAEAGNCAGSCQNQRFQRKQYANVSVIKTEKKGFGLRADADLQANDFVFEYIGEVINEPTFRRRMIQYDEEGIKHFYFMSLNKSEFVDATKKGNYGRFCNHSCNPNCYVDKWVVGDKLRMGIFASRKIQSGEELVFNYNVDRYGADPQPCYCGEANCVGFIGGKTQTERATKLPVATVEALGIDGGDGWDTSVAKKPRKKKPDEDDEEYVNSIPSRSLNEDDARKVMAALMQCKEKWIAVKLLDRILRCDEERVIHCVMRMHAYQILKTTLNTFIEDHNVVLQVLDILDKLPRLTRNKIQDSKIEATIEGLTRSEHQDVASKSKYLLDEWSKLEVAYRIRRRKFDPNAPAANSFEERRGAGRDEEAAQSSKTASPQTIDAPKGPRNSMPQRNVAFFQNGGRPRRPPFNGGLPQGWFTAKDAAGNTYFYNKQGTTTWQRPTQPVAEPAVKAPSKAMKEQLAIQSIINQVTERGTPKHTSVSTPKTADTPPKEVKEEKWRSLPVEKQMKIYENTVFPHIKHVLDKFHHKLPKEELKRFGKEIAKKLVSSDYKNNRVGDPNAPLSEKQARKVKQYVKDFLDRAVKKFGDQQKPRVGDSTDTQMKGDRGPSAAGSSTGSVAGGLEGTSLVNVNGTPADGLDAATASDNEGSGSLGSPERKRKRESEVEGPLSISPSDGPNMKRLREDELDAPSPPPPPPPPPQSAMEGVVNAEQQALREQEEALMRENEEAQRLEDEANHSKDLEDATRGAGKDLLDVSNELSRLNHEARGIGSQKTSV